MSSLPPRAVPVQETLRALDEALLARAPEAIALKHEKMAHDPYSFFRGAVRVFLQDLADGALLAEHAGDAARVWLQGDHGDPAGDVWLSGDLHLGNTGVISLEDKTLVYDLNDFDESGRGPYLVDVQRLAASLVLAGDEAPLARDASLDAVSELARGYVAALREVESGALGPRWHWTEENARGAILDALHGGHKKRKSELFDKFCEEKKGEGRLRHTDEVLPVSDAVRGEVEASVPAYLVTLDSDWRRKLDEFVVLDVARRLGSGIGSMGLDRFYVLVRGKSRDPKDARILEWKEERASALETILPGAGAGFADEAVRAVEAAVALLGERPRLLGHTRLGDRAFLVREKSAHKAAIEVPALTEPGRLAQAARDTARCVARAHAHSRGVEAPTTARTLLAAAGDEAAFTAALRRFAGDYADRTREDHAAFLRERAR